MISEINKEFYTDRFDPKYDAFSRDRFEKSIALMDGVKGKLLDVGCGDGSFTRRLKKEGIELYGAEISDKNAAAANSLGIKTKVCDLNAGKLPFSAGTFDAVFCGDVLEHIYDTDSMVAEINRVLKKDGVLVISTPNIASWYNRGVLMLGWLPFWIESGSRKGYGAPFACIWGHVKAFTKSSLTELLEAKGFEIEKTIGGKINVGVYTKAGKENAGAKVFSFFENLFSRRTSLASCIIVRARKA